MKILYTNASSQLGGAERNLIDVICAVQRQDPTIEIAVLITAPDGPLVAELTPLGVKIVILELPRKIAQLGDSGLPIGGNKIANALKLVASISLVADFVRYWWQFRRTIVKIAPDTIHSNGFKTHLLVASLGTSIPIVWHLHDFISSRLAIGKLLKLLIGRVTVAIAISQAVATDWQSLFSDLNIKLIYNAIDTDKYRPSRADLEPNTDFSQVKIGLVATYALWKGHDIFIQAIGQIARQDPALKSQVKFYIIGGAIYETARSQYSRSTLQQLARDLNVADWLTFIDFQSDIVASYNLLDIIVHTSTKPEPFGRTIVEAMACEKAVIVSSAGGAAELFTHQQDAIGITPGDPAMLAAAIGNLIDNPATRIAIGKAGRINAIERFSLDRLGLDIVSLYRQIARSSLR
jgi:glycosyltransferase involved in cell wall biosynthesis